MTAADAGDPAESANQPELPDRYGIEFDFESVPRLCEEHGLVFPT
ncbi:MAG: hypothetical protein ACR2H9_09160 [Longimicrobiaceae bacterium]